MRRAERVEGERDLKKWYKDRKGVIGKPPGPWLQSEVGRVGHGEAL